MTFTRIAARFLARGAAQDAAQWAARYSVKVPLMICRLVSLLLFVALALFPLCSEEKAGFGEWTMARLCDRGPARSAKTWVPCRSRAL
jgi:hypothetical protein